MNIKILIVTFITDLTILIIALVRIKWYEIQCKRVREDDEINDTNSYIQLINYKDMMDKWWIWDINKLKW